MIDTKNIMDATILLLSIGFVTFVTGCACFVYTVFEYNRNKEEDNRGEERD